MEYQSTLVNNWLKKAEEHTNKVKKIGMTHMNSFSQQNMIKLTDKRGQIAQANIFCYYLLHHCCGQL